MVFVFVQFTGRWKLDRQVWTCQLLQPVPRTDTGCHWWVANLLVRLVINW